MKMYLTEKGINFSEVGQGFFKFLIPENYSNTIHRNLEFYKLEHAILSGLQLAKNESDGINYYHSTASGELSFDNGCALSYKGPFKAGFFTVLKLIQER